MRSVLPQRGACGTTTLVRLTEARPDHTEVICVLYVSLARHHFVEIVSGAFHPPPCKKQLLACGIIITVLQHHGSQKAHAAQGHHPG